MTSKLFPLLAASVGLAACASTQGGTEASGGAAAEAVLIDKDGQRRGTATFAEAGGGVTVTVSASGLPAGAKGLHLHTVGKCDAPDFATAGPHWNPTTRQHGSGNPQGPHLGDIPNIAIDASGSGQATATIAGASLRGGTNPLLDADGTAIIIHAAADDYRTDPSGNSGGRVACGVVRAR